MNKSNFEWNKWIPITITAILLMVIYKTFDNFAQITSWIGKFLSVLSPLLFGILFSYFLYTPFKKVNQRFGKSKIKFIAKRKKFFSVTFVFFLLCLIIVFIALVIAPILLDSVLELAGSIPFYVNSLLNYIEILDDDTYLAAFNISESLAGFFDDAISRYFNFALMEQVTRSVIGIAAGLANIVLGLIITLYILADLENIAAFFDRLGRAVVKNVKYRERLNKYLRQVNTVLFTFLSSKGLDSIINIVVVTAILLIFNVPFAFLFGFIAGVFNFIPYLGSLIAMTFISLINIITAGPGKALQVLVVLLIFQQIDANYIEPKIMNTSLKISPILVIVSVIAAGAYFGIAGMFLAVPVVTVVKQLLIEYMDHHTK
ncbi:MAG: AI-2E family transporter [Lachnospiraceae bacterium]|nr:AI-2E family transporter [Lachnospiraceae bacterium]